MCSPGEEKIGLHSILLSSSLTVKKRKGAGKRMRDKTKWAPAFRNGPGIVSLRTAARTVLDRAYSKKYSIIENTTRKSNNTET